MVAGAGGGPLINVRVCACASPAANAEIQISISARVWSIQPSLAFEESPLLLTALFDGEVDLHPVALRGRDMNTDSVNLLIRQVADDLVRTARSGAHVHSLRILVDDIRMNIASCRELTTNWPLWRGILCGGPDYHDQK